MAEWSMAVVLKTTKVQAFGGSNPSPSAKGLVGPEQMADRQYGSRHTRQSKQSPEEHRSLSGRGKKLGVRRFDDGDCVSRHGGPFGSYREPPRPEVVRAGRSFD